MSGGWTARFPGLAEAGNTLCARLEASAGAAELEAGAVVFRPGAPCAAYLMVLEGCVRVRQIGENGREIVLYRVGPGETCILTTACLLGGERYPAEGVVEEAVRARALPRPVFEELIAASPAFRRFVLAGFGRRIVQLMEVIDAVAFQRVDARLARLLLERCDRAGVVVATHQELAVELGSAREVVSRRLKVLAESGAIALERGRLAVRDRAALARAASSVT